MRVLQFLFTSLILFAIVAGIAFLVGREALLLWGTSALRSNLSELHAISRNATDYARQCRQKGTPANTKIIDRLQLRFTSSTEYVMEVICVQFPLDPIVIRKATLPLFVHKRPGTSGVIWGNDPSGVGIEVLGRKRDVYVLDERIQASQPDRVQFVTAPQTTCQGLGFKCCQTEQDSGVGQLQSSASDCPRSCYSACVARPVVLSFSSDPFFEGSERTISIGSGETVTFSYVTSYAGTGLIDVVLEYGDGQQDSFQTLSGQSTHTYDCPTGGCQYTAQLKVRHESGAESAVTPITQIQVQVR